MLLLNRKFLNLLKLKFFKHDMIWDDYRIKSPLCLLLSIIMALNILTVIALPGFSINDTTSDISNINSSIQFASNQNNSTTTITTDVEKKKGCNCIVFRMDDVQDYWLNKVQLAVMDLFLDKNETVSLGLIMNAIGNDSQVVNMIKEGLDKNLFELSLHGWNHTEYTNLTGQEQKESLQKSNNKMYDLFSKNSYIFIPPLSVFNNETLKAMTDLGLRVISSDIPEETKFSDGNSIFVAKNLKDSNRFNETSNQQNSQNQTAYHIPATIFFKDYENGQWIKIPNDEIIANSTKNIEKYGYSAIVLHPQDFAILSENKSGSHEQSYSNSVNLTEIDDLSKLIETIKSEKMRIIGFDNIVNQYDN